MHEGSKDPQCLQKDRGVAGKKWDGSCSPGSEGPALQFRAKLEFYFKHNEKLVELLRRN